MANLITFSRGDPTKITANFARNEFACPCGCNAQMIDAELVGKLQQVRDLLGVPLTITSGYRCLAHNSKVGARAAASTCMGWLPTGAPRMAVSILWRSVLWLRSISTR
jgi:hypothetical protein